jgi:predicted nucleotidyltransferase
MKNLLRASSRKYSDQEAQAIAREVLQKVLLSIQPKRVVLFGSAVTGSFDEYSDLDFLLIFETETQAKEAQKTVYRSVYSPLRKIDWLCIDEKNLKEKVKKGGVYAVALSEGITLHKS